MKRGFLIATGALVGTIGSVVYQAGSWQPSFLVGQTEGVDLGGNTAPTASGTRKLTGDVIMTHYGPVQVELTVTDGNIDDVKMLQVPTGQNQRWTDHAIPILIQETLSAQSADISNVSGCSYTTQGFVQSLQSALTQI